MTDIPDQGPSQVQARNEEIFSLLMEWGQTGDAKLAEILAKLLQLVSEVHLAATENDGKLAVLCGKMSTAIADLSLALHSKVQGPSYDDLDPLSLRNRG